MVSCLHLTRTERRGRARRRNSSASLAAPAALSVREHVCKHVCVCVWPAGTGTADPPLTPGGVHRAVEED